MNKPKVSVLMPIYNTPIKHLKESIDSILDQTFTDFEFLIVNDSPKNEALDEFVNSFNDKRIRYFKNDKNRGIEFSTNFLIKQAQGEYLAIFDHDDISLPERLEKEVAFLDANPDYGVVSGQFKVFGIEDWTSQNPLNDSEIKELLKTASCVSHTSLMIRAETLRQNNIRYEKKFFPASSYRIITRLATITKVANLPDLVLLYRMDGNNTSLKFADRRVTARKRLRKEYKNKLRQLELISLGRFDKIKLITTDSASSNDNHYYAEKAGEKFFIKESIHSFAWEFESTKRAFKQNPNYFSEPIEFFKQGEWNYLVLRWEDGENLAKFIKKNKLTPTQKKNFVKDLEEISIALCAVKLVHRDIIPRNLMVVNNKLKLVDFYFSVDYDNYYEYKYIIKDIASIRLLGEDFAAGVYKWDDAYSFVEVAKYIVGENQEYKYPIIEKILADVGKRVITPEGSIFSHIIVEQSDNIDYLKKLLADRESTIQQLEKIISDEEAIINDLKLNINNIQKSGSYRVGKTVTYPYRAVKKIIK